MAEERERAYLTGETQYVIQDGTDFAFDPISNLFHIADANFTTTIETSELDAVLRLSSRTGGEQSGLIMGPLGMAESPQLRAQIRDIAADKEKLYHTRVTVAGVMKDVLKKASPPSIREVLEEMDEEISNGLEFMTYNAAIRSDGTFILNTFGNCACLGPDPHSMVVSVRGGNSWTQKPDIPVGLALHNNDNDWQTLSLLAGAGALAWIAQGRESGQLDLGLIK